MSNQIQKTVCALAVLAATSLPALAEVVNNLEVEVIGAITPAACTPTVSGGGTIDYGVIAFETLVKNDYTVLPEKQLDFAITCNAPAKVAVQAINNRVGSSAGSNTDNATGANQGTGPNLFGYKNIARAGLGLAKNNAGAKIGGYGLRLVPGEFTADSKAVITMQRNDLAAAWVETASASVFNTLSRRQITWAATGTTVPVAFKVLSGKLEVQAFINKVSMLDTSSPILLNGSTTLELYYL